MRSADKRAHLACAADQCAIAEPLGAMLSIVNKTFTDYLSVAFVKKLFMYCNRLLKRKSPFLPGPIHLSPGRGCGSLVTALCFVLASISAFAQTNLAIVVALDTITYKRSVTNNVEKEVHDYKSIVCTTGDNTWKMDATFTNASISWFYDGKILYCSRKSQVRAAGSNTKEHDTIIVYETDNGYPSAEPWINIPWLAFCSGQYLRVDGRRVPSVCLEGRHEPDTLAYNDKTQTFTDGFGLPSSVDLFSARHLLAKSVERKDFLGKHDLALWERGAMGFKYPQLDGTHIFHYEVTQSTNMEGNTIPIIFQWVCYSSLESNAIVSSRGTGRVVSIHPCDKPTAVFNDNPSNTVVDWRFRDDSNNVNGIIYRSVSSQLLPTNDPHLQQVFNAYRKQLHSEPPSTKRRSILLLGFASITIVSGLFVAYAIRRRE